MKFTIDRIKTIASLYSVDLRGYHADSLCGGMTKMLDAIDKALGVDTTGGKSSDRIHFRAKYSNYVGTRVAILENRSGFAFIDHCHDVREAGIKNSRKRYFHHLGKEG